jgi:hypothetical protein
MSTATEFSLARLYVMRLLFALNFAMLGAQVWPVLLNHPAPWDPVRGVAFAFWAALSTLSLLGIRYPVKMVPVLLTQFTYKGIWLLAVYPTLQGPAELTRVMAGGLIADVIVIPWVYVFSSFVRSRGDRWK